MEQHAVPQDITGFKFKLVGDMTLKQFGELASGAILAYIFYASTLPAFLKWPLVTLLGFLGFALAFLPIEERPLDVWIINFIKAIYQPTLYLWKKNAAVTFDAPPLVRQPEPIEIKQEVGPEIKTETKQEIKPVIDKPAAAAAPPPGPLSVEDLQKLRDSRQWELSTAQKDLEETVAKLKSDLYKAAQPKIVTVDVLGEKRDEKKNSSQAQLVDLVKQNTDLSAQIETVKTKILGLRGMDTTQLQAQLTTLSQQRETLEKQIAGLREQLYKAPPPATEAVKMEGGAQIRVVEKPVVRQATMSLTEIPNIINGIVNSDGGIPLEGTVLLVKDKAGNSLRALKANKVGQFIASTPLENGTYYLEFEKPDYNFDVLELTLSGQVMQPIEIIGKANGHS